MSHKEIISSKKSIDVTVATKSPKTPTKEQQQSLLIPEVEQSPKKVTFQENVATYLRVDFELFRVFAAEMLGTFVLIAFGVGSCAQFILNDAPIGQNVMTVMLGWAFGVGLGIFVAGNASGAHLNPAVTLAMGVLGRLSWIKVPVYMCAQYVGAFAASLVVYIVYINDLNEFDKSNNVTRPLTTAGIWATYPKPNIETWECFIDQIVSTGLLVLMVMAITDEKNMNVPKALVPLSVSMTIFSLMAAFMSNCGSAMNPARDLSPRLFTAIAGWGGQVFSHRGYNYFWVPIIGPHIGALLGAWLYNICIGLHWLQEKHKSV